MIRAVSCAGVIALLLLPTAIGPAGAEMIVRKRISYFAVSGKTAADLDREFARRGPKLSHGGRHPGATEMTFGGSVEYSERDGRCVIADATVTLDLKVILPRWKERRRAGRDLAIVWDTLSRDIRRHEDRHAEIARIYARKLEQKILDLRSRSTCAALEAKVTEATDEVLAEHDKDQARFDRIETINFERRMTQLLEYRLQQIERAREKRRK